MWYWFGSFEISEHSSLKMLYDKLSSKLKQPNCFYCMILTEVKGMPFESKLLHQSLLTMITSTKTIFTNNCRQAISWQYNLRFSFSFDRNTSFYDIFHFKNNNQKLYTHVHLRFYTLFTCRSYCIITLEDYHGRNNPNKIDDIVYSELTSFRK